MWNLRFCFETQDYTFTWYIYIYDMCWDLCLNRPAGESFQECLEGLALQFLDRGRSRSDETTSGNSWGFRIFQDMTRNDCLLFMSIDCINQLPLFVADPNNPGAEPSSESHCVSVRQQGASGNHEQMNKRICCNLLKRSWRSWDETRTRLFTL